jgi:hypothetical protein
MSINYQIAVVLTDQQQRNTFWGFGPATIKDEFKLSNLTKVESQPSPQIELIHEIIGKYRYC